MRTWRVHVYTSEECHVELVWFEWVPILCVSYFWLCIIFSLSCSSEPVYILMDMFVIISWFWMQCPISLCPLWFFVSYITITFVLWRSCIIKSKASIHCLCSSSFLNIFHYLVFVLLYTLLLALSFLYQLHYRSAGVLHHIQSLLYSSFLFLKWPLRVLTFSNYLVSYRSLLLKLSIFHGAKVRLAVFLSCCVIRISFSFPFSFSWLYIERHLVIYIYFVFFNTSVSLCSS